MDDYRVKVGFVRHPKLKALKRRIGPGAADVLLCLWDFCTSNPSRRDGSLRGMAPDAVADACEFDGDPSELVRHLRETGWLDGRSRSLRVHDWAEHQPYVANWKSRSDKARHAASMRWASPEDTGGMQHASGGDAPSPTPTPTPKKAAPISVSSGEETNPDVGLVMQAYLQKYSDREAQCMKPEARRLVRSLLADNYTVGQLERAIAGNAADPWHAEKNYTSIRHIFKDPETVDKWISGAPVPRTGNYVPVDEESFTTNPDAVAAARAEVEKVAGKLRM